MVYTIDEIRRRIEPVAKEYNLAAVYLFGSYARNEARDDSDVDFLVDITGGVHLEWACGGVYNDLSEAVNKKIDMVTTDVFDDKDTKECNPWLIENIQKERVQIYG
ncbi:MAG: nucleotidyltransferase domain-containing protein [Oscillospiraceae bacterium]|jgi:predicted nucleotidyltransferase|nr:nucleotidyltransferase domain-containing protein [Oscillospiraceae bacterium]